jgi:hypothetical protein
VISADFLARLISGLKSLCQRPAPAMGLSNAAAVGDAGLVLLLVLTILITACMLYQLPSPEYFDDDWIRHGFCVSNADTTWLNSHSLSFYADVVLALFIARLFANQPKSAPPLQAALLSGAIFGVFGHGLGHLYLGTNTQGMDLRFRPEDIPMSVASILVTVMAFGAIFQGTMPLSSRSRLAMTAVVATAGFTVLDIAPKLNFVYAQAAIYISNALHMLIAGQIGCDVCAVSVLSAAGAIRRGTGKYGLPRVSSTSWRTCPI